nr:MAG TPA: hypothetical protein [Caudoviricetes sp.]
MKNELKSNTSGTSLKKETYRGKSEKPTGYEQSKTDWFKKGTDF